MPGSVLRSPLKIVSLPGVSYLCLMKNLQRTLRTVFLTGLAEMMILGGSSCGVLGVTVLAAEAPYTLSVDPDPVVPKGTVQVSWTAPEGHSSFDWIGLYRRKAKSGFFHPSIEWHKITSATSGTVTFTAPARPGVYEFRFSHWNSYQLLASDRLEVSRPNLTACLGAPGARETRSKIKHLVVIVQENHSFDNYFGQYCRAPVGSDPSCNDGPDCCEAGPKVDPGSGLPPVVLNDQSNIAFDPDHTQACELQEMNGGLMNRYVEGAIGCSNPGNFAYADPALVKTYRDYAASYALADRFFHPVVGSSSSNDMYLARASFVFLDNTVIPDATTVCVTAKGEKKTYTDTTIGDLLSSCRVPWSFFSEGYRAATGHVGGPGGPTLPGVPQCLGFTYDPSDNPFEYFDSTQDNGKYLRDLEDFFNALNQKRLPAVSFIKPVEARSEHPLFPISAGVGFVKNIVDQVLESPYKDDTLILLTADESGGYFDHIAPPGVSPVDHQPYGPRTYLIAIGPFAKTNYVSHVMMEHSSIVKFIEWNFLGGEPGQLGTRDAVVNGLGSLLDPAKTGVEVP